MDGESPLETLAAALREAGFKADLTPPRRSAPPGVRVVNPALAGTARMPVALSETVYLHEGCFKWPWKDVICQASDVEKAAEVIGKVLAVRDGA